LNWRLAPARDNDHVDRPTSALLRVQVAVDGEVIDYPVFLVEPLPKISLLLAGVGFGALIRILDVLSAQNQHCAAVVSQAPRGNGPQSRNQSG
jgi:hypothetical protein